MAQARLNYTTPQSTAQYPWLQPNKPDTKFDEDGVWKTNLLVPSKEAQPLIDKINEFAKEQLGDKISKAMLPYATDADTGEIIFKTKSKFAPKIKDSQGQLMMDNVPQIWGGSVIRIAGTLTAYDKGINCGIKLNLNAVQLIKPAEGNGNDGDDFGAVEGGYVASKTNTQQETDEFSDDF